MAIHAHFFRRLILTRKVDQSLLVFDVHRGLLKGLCTQNYKSPCVAVTICATLVNVHTHRDRRTDSI